jgi:phosphatidylserine/phosphatidylglycerophosphate/cardiolipin synthase-like enzyme
MSSIRTVQSPWESSFYDILGSAQSSLLITSPFIKCSQANALIDRLQSSGVSSQIHISIMTDLKPDNILAGSLDVEALLAFSDMTPNLTVTYLPNLHAKVYVADQNTAIITSANFTDGGLRKNFEYGVVVSDPLIVSRVRSDLDQYASLGNVVSRQTLEALCGIAKDLKILRQKAERSIRQQFRKAFNQKIEAAKLELLSVRAEGKTTHGIFADTILYLLAKGPLRTVELHPLIQQLHPDLCNDSEDRIIKGVHFGKRWKHHVRNAQVYLRRKGLIYSDGTYWKLKISR